MKYIETLNAIICFIVWAIIYASWIWIFLIPAFKECKSEFKKSFVKKPKDIKVYLDDERTAPDGWIRAYDYVSCIQALKYFKPTHLSLDHDLGEGKSGYDVVKWIEEKVFNDSSYQPPIMTVHSANPAGRKNMELGINSIKRILENRK